MSTSILSTSEFEESLNHYHSSGTSSWESDVSVGNIFRELSVNMVSTSRLEDGDEEMIQLDADHWIKHLNTLWDIRFKQHEPPTEDKVTQINLGDEANPKPIFISESLSPFEKKDLISLVREYMDVFAWNYENMSGLDPQVVYASPQHQSGCEARQTTAAMVPPEDNGSNPIRSQEAHRL